MQNFNHNSPKEDHLYYFGVDERIISIRISVQGYKLDSAGSGQNSTRDSCKKVYDLLHYTECKNSSTNLATITYLRTWWS
jgi:hypothetical protein